LEAIKVQEAIIQGSAIDQSRGVKGQFDDQIGMTAVQTSDGDLTTGVESLARIALCPGRQRGLLLCVFFEQLLFFAHVFPAP
jgi:hypothetical protein